MNWSGILTMLVSFIGTLSSAGPWGIAAMALGAMGLLGGMAFLIGKWNQKVDSSDIDRSGADAGNTAVDLKGQADRNRDFENAEREQIKKEKLEKDKLH